MTSSVLAISRRKGREGKEHSVGRFLAVATGMLSLLRILLSEKAAAFYLDCYYAADFNLLFCFLPIYRTSAGCTGPASSAVSCPAFFAAEFARVCCTER